GLAGVGPLCPGHISARKESKAVPAYHRWHKQPRRKGGTVFMEASKTVWRGLVQQFKAIVPDLHGHQAKTLGLWVVGALLAGSVRIPAVAEARLLQAVSDARLPSLERRLARWLAHPRPDVAAIWQACLPTLLRAWRADGHPARLVLDATPLADRAQV